MQAQRRAEQAFARVVAMSWQDDSYRRALIKNPGAVLRAAGVDVPAGVRLHVHQDGERELHLVLPPKPADGTSAAFQLAARATPQACTNPPRVLTDMDLMAAGKPAKGTYSRGKKAAMRRKIKKWKNKYGRAALIAEFNYLDDIGKVPRVWKK